MTTMNSINKYPNIIKVVESQRSFFRTSTTLSLDCRIKALSALREEIIRRDADISAALKKDLNKSEVEAQITEIIGVHNELSGTLKKLPKWVKPRKAKTPLAFLPGYSQLRPEPYGNTLIIGPWNFPFSLLMLPMIGSVAAGNTVLCKPSEHAPATARICREIIEAVFDPQHVACVEGGVPETTAILTERWDYVFFTGSPHVGRIVYQAAAKHLTPVTLELGGKSPCIVDSSASMDTAAKRIVAGKYMNAGQICIAPDYLFVEESIKDELVLKLKKTIVEFYGDNPQDSEDFGRMINERNFDRVAALIDNNKVIHGGKTDRSDKYISPTLLDGVTNEDAVMQEEIFGPVLPILTWKNLSEVKDFINAKEKPLILYMFSKNKSNIDDVLSHCSSGGVTVNDCFLSQANKNLPFGGVGLSGMGSYNGDFTFDTFSHLKAEVHKSAGRKDPDLRYPPYNQKKLNLLKWVANKLT